MDSNYDICFGLCRKKGRTLFKQAGIYYDGTNVVVRMLNNGKLVVLSKNVLPMQLSYKCRNLLDTSMAKGRVNCDCKRI